LIRTGPGQTQGFSQAQFKNAVCARIYGLFNCQGGLYVDVKTYAGLGDGLLQAASHFAEEVRSGVYPGPEHTYH